MAQAPATDEIWYTLEISDEGQMRVVALVILEAAKEVQGSTGRVRLRRIVGATPDGRELECIASQVYPTAEAAATIAGDPMALDLGLFFET